MQFSGERWLNNRLVSPLRLRPPSGKSWIRHWGTILNAPRSHGVMRPMIIFVLLCKVLSTSYCKLTLFMSLPLVSIGSINATNAARTPRVAYTPRAMWSDFSSKTYIESKKRQIFFFSIFGSCQGINICVVLNLITIINTG